MSGTTRIVDYEQDGQTYEGFLAMPEGNPKGVVLVAHAWGGQSEFEQDKAKLLASWGYAGFAADVYGKGKRGETNEECEALMPPLATNRGELQSRLACALDVAKRESGSDKAAAIGFCFEPYAPLTKPVHRIFGLKPAKGTAQGLATTGIVIHHLSRFKTVVGHVAATAPRNANLGQGLRACFV